MRSGFGDIFQRGHVDYPHGPVLSGPLVQLVPLCVVLIIWLMLFHLFSPVEPLPLIFKDAILSDA